MGPALGNVNPRTEVVMTMTDRRNTVPQRDRHFARSALAALITLMAFGLSGCAEVQSLIGWVSDANNSIPVAQQISQRLIPHGMWWLVALFALWTLVRRTGIQVWTVGLGIVFLVVEAILTTWNAVSGMTLVLLFVGYFLFGGVAAVILRVLATGLSYAKSGFDLAKKGHHLATELASKDHKEEADEESDEVTGKQVALAIFSVLAACVILATLFGGELPKAEWAKLTTYQAFVVVLRGIGIGLAGLGVIFALWDATHSTWVCEACDERNWDLHRNQVRCEHCGALSPRASWKCEAKHGKHACGAKNPAKAPRCRKCGAANPHLDEDGCLKPAEDHEHHDEPEGAKWCWTGAEYKLLRPSIAVPEGWTVLKPEQLSREQLDQLHAAPGGASAPHQPPPVAATCGNDGGPACRAATIRLGAKFCAKCGKSLATASVPSPAPSATPRQPSRRKAGPDRGI